MRQCIRMLMMVLFLVVGTAPVVLAFGGHGGFHGGGHGGFHGGFHGGGFHGGGFGHHGFPGGSFGHRGWHHWGYGSGIYFDVPPLWIAPEPYYVAPAPSIGVTPEPPALWYYCTDPPGYYPTVPTCHVPWTPVPQD